LFTLASGAEKLVATALATVVPVDLKGPPPLVGNGDASS
jgi:hypothetical protein